MDCYILHTVLLMTVLLFVIDVLTIYKMENNELKNLVSRIVRVIILMT